MVGQATFKWADSKAGQRVLEISDQSGQPSVVRLANILDPGIKSAFYGISGQLNYTGVQGDGFLEMWNNWLQADGRVDGQFFSRTLANSGLLQKVSGDSGWRPFRLPAMIDNRPDRPNNLVINLHLPANGTVRLAGTAELREYPDRHQLLGAKGEWWSSRYAGWIGGGIGAFFGCWGGLIGMLAQAGRGRAFIQASVWFNIVFGSASLVLGLVALAMSQPYHIWYPFILIGVLLPGIMLGTRKNLLKQLAAAEERKMAAMDAVPH